MNDNQTRFHGLKVDRTQKDPDLTIGQLVLLVIMARSLKRRHWSVHHADTVTKPTSYPLKKGDERGFFFYIFSQMNEPRARVSSLRSEATKDLRRSCG